MTQTDLAAFTREWDRFESWLVSHSPADHAALRGPAGQERITALEAQLGFPLHPELRALLERHDGAGTPEAARGPRGLLPAGGFLPSGHRLCGVDDIAAMHDVLVGVGEDNIEADLWDEGHLAVNLRRCVPFALPHDGGVAFVDHRPGPSYGHVYEMGIGAGDLDGTLWAASPARLFRALADSLETDTPFLDYRPVSFEDAPGHHHCLEWEFRP